MRKTAGHSTLGIRHSGNGFSIFELLAVLTVIGIALVVTLGSYGSWSTARAITGAADTVCAGLREARELAKSQGKYVAFYYAATNSFHVRYYFKISMATNGIDTIESIASAGSLPKDYREIEACPLQYLSDAVMMEHADAYNTSTREITVANENDTVFFFRPDGSILDPYQTGSSTHPHWIILSTKDRFSRNKNISDSLYNLIAIDLYTGLFTSEEIKP